MAEPVAFRAGATALVRAVARPDLARLPFPDFDDRSFTAEERAEITTKRLAWVRDVWDDSVLAEAVRHASPVLAAQTEALCMSAAPGGRDVRRVGLSLARYLLRAGHRATPFGLFAGVATADFGTPAKAVWGKAHVVVARASAEWLSQMVEQLEKSGELLPLLSVVVSNTSFERDGHLIVPYQEEGLSGRQRAVEASIELTAPVRIVLGAAGSPIRVEALAGKLTAEFPSVLPERVHGLLAGLIRRRVLVTNLQVPATEPDALGHVLSQLDAVEAGTLVLARTVRELRAVQAGLQTCDSADARESVAARMRDLVPGLRRHPLALDLRLDAHLTLSDEVARETERAATVLTRLSARPYGSRAWADYHQRFYERYGIGTMVPLLDVLADSGIGYPDGYPGAPSSGRRRVSVRDDVLVRLAQTAVLDGHDEVVLTDELVAALDRGSGEQRVPPHLEVGVRLHAASVEEAQRGRFTIEVTSVSRGVGVTTGRFASVLGCGPREALCAELAELPTADAGTDPAQLSFPPLLPDTAHVARAPRVLPLVISLEEHRAASADVLTPADLAVACDGRRMYLAAPLLGRRIEAAGMHALNLTEHTAPMARFLAEIGRAQYAQVTVFDWGAAAAMPFLPRLKYGRIVLAPARWRLNACDLPGRDRPGAEWDTALSAWRDRRRLPRHVRLAEDDRLLPLDLDQGACRSLLRQHLDCTPSAVLIEAAPAPSYGWSGGRAHDIVVPLKTTRPSVWPTLPQPSAARTLSRAQIQPPASSSVLLAALYADPRRQDAVLTRHVPDLIRRLGSPPWWFIRFRDPHQHLRLRIALPHPDDFADTAHTVSMWADELRAAELLADLRYPTSYREMGRWGSGPAWNAAEEVFQADSRAVVAELAQPRRPQQRTLVAAHTVAICSAFLGSPEAGARWLIDHVPHRPTGPVPRPQLAEAVRLSDPRDDWAALRTAAAGEAIVTAWADRSAALAAYRQHLPGPHTVGIALDDVLTSLLHTHFVRHVAVNFPEEEICLRLARAAALAFTARAGSQQ
ncbi:lantibiotic dehydratase (plasmid) [Streptomyces sp. NBC_00015]|uniref:lantibiotic dehydratase n=1 Tax=Streptomyces sp. NBC_00015 TaxID=2903611 RepID=UPI002F91A1FE